MKKNQKLGWVLAMATLVFVSCSKDQDGESETQSESINYASGVLISNEGSFSSSNASVSHFDLSTAQMSNDVFYTVNNRPLGAILQSIYTYADQTFLIVNVSNKIEVVKTSDFTEQGVIDDVVSPRYMTVANGKGYVSQWGTNQGSVKVLDLNSNTVTKTIQTGVGTEGIIEANNLIWAANGGGYGLDSTVSVIDPVSDVVVSTVVVGDNPKELVEDVDGNIWVLCAGSTEYDTLWNPVAHTPSELVKINASTKEVMTTIEISPNLNPMHLDVNPSGTTIYCGGGSGFNGIYAIDKDATSLPTSFSILGSFYGFNVNSSNGDVYALSAPSFTENGSLSIYSSAGVLGTERTVGIGPNGAIFN